MIVKLGEMHLFNDTSQKHVTSFILNGKEWEVGKTESERKRKSESESVSDKGLWRGS